MKLNIKHGIVILLIANLFMYMYLGFIEERVILEYLYFGMSGLMIIGLTLFILYLREEKKEK